MVDEMHDLVSSSTHDIEERIVNVGISTGKATRRQRNAMEDDSEGEIRC